MNRSTNQLKDDKDDERENEISDIKLTSRKYCTETLVTMNLNFTEILKNDLKFSQSFAQNY